MTVKTRKERGVTILELSGRFTVGGGASELRETGQAVLGAGETAVVMDCHGITLMDSSGLGELVAVQQAATRAGASLRLARLPGQAADLLRAAGLLASFSVYADVAGAIRSF